jgi:hypothetical protein
VRDALRREIQNRRQSIMAFYQEYRSDVMQLSPADRSVLQQYLLRLFPNDLQALLDQLHDAKTPEARKEIIASLLKAATDHGIKPEEPGRGGPRGNLPPGGRGGRGQGSGGNGRGGPRNNDGPHPRPMPPPAPAPLPAPTS